MQPRIRAPKFGQRKIVIRTAQNKEDTRQANKLISDTYIREGFWSEGENHADTDKWLITPHRTVILVIDKERDDDIIGTVSVVSDSPDGLPADSFQPDVLNEFRANGERLAQVTSLAFKKGQEQHKLVLFLFKYTLQYVFYYTWTERLLSLCNPKHARFYNVTLGFEPLGEPVYYPYAKAMGQLSSLDLVEAHNRFSASDQSDRADTGSFYHFLLGSEKGLEFPDTSLMLRSRARGWSRLPERSVQAV